MRCVDVCTALPLQDEFKAVRDILDLKLFSYCYLYKSIDLLSGGLKAVFGRLCFTPK